MFERFTDSARRAVVMAQEEARELQHNYIGTEHLVLGVIAGDPSGLPARVLQGIGLPLDQARSEVIAIVGRGKKAASGHIPFTPRAKKTLELALREALQLGHDYIGPEHILLGVIREGQGVGAQVMRTHAKLHAIRLDLIQALPPGGGARFAGRRWLRRQDAGDPFEPVRPGTAAEHSALSATPAADTTLSQAARLAGARPVGSHHLLLAALSDSTTAAVRALGSLGLDLELAKEALRAVDVAGTSDEQPEEAGRRQMVIRVTGDKLTLEATDPVIVQAGLAAAAALGEEADPAGTIRGEAPECSSLSLVWRELRESLDIIAGQASRPVGGLAGETETGESPGTPNNPDPPGTEAA
jgi:ATP-dependent Clp protease ATP-binding subunit ClpA